MKKYIKLLLQILIIRQMQICDNICIYQNALSVELCNDIIDIFESNKLKPQSATTLGGVENEVLTATSLFCTDIDHTNWPRIRKCIEQITITKMTQYFKKLVNSLDISSEQTDFEFFDQMIWRGFSINKYSADEKGHYVYHTDRHVILETDEERIVTFIYYLKDVENGGETRFPGQGLTVKPEAGKLILFPSTWTYPHCSLPTISNDKYIIVGWFLVKHYRSNPTGTDTLN